MSEPARIANIASEVAWGESVELGILRRWLKLSMFAHGATGLIKSPDFAPYDFLIFDKQGLPLCVVEVKRRRVEFKQYGDALFPYAKHLFAGRVKDFNIPCVGVVEWSCGTLGEVDLTKRPSKTDHVTRRDRPGSKGAKHGFWSKRQIVVLAEGL